MLEYKGYKGDWSYSSEHACFYGKIVKYERISFRGNSEEEMILDFHKKVEHLIKRKEKYNIS